MKIKLILLLVCINIWNTVVSQDFEELNLLELGTISMPANMSYSDQGQVKVFSGDDDVAIYLILVTNFPNGIPLKTTKDLDNFYNQSIAQTLEISDGNLIQSQIIDIEGNVGAELLFKSSNIPNVNGIRYRWFLALDNYSVTIEFISKDNDNSNNLVYRDAFFSSFVLNNNDLTTNIIDNLKNPEKEFLDKTPYEVSSDIGKFVGQLLFILIILIVLGLLIWLIKYFLKKVNRKTEIRDKIEANMTTSIGTICKQCDFENKTNTIYCSRCGHSLKG